MGKGRRQHEERAGRIVAAHGRRVVVEARDGTTRACRLFGRKLQVVCGDDVQWVEAEAEGADGLVVSLVQPEQQKWIYNKTLSWIMNSL